MDDEQGSSGGGRRVWIGAGAALVVVGLLAAISVLGGHHASPSGTSPDPGAQARATAAKRIPGDPLALGSPTAPVTIVEWEDFQCPFCGAFTRDTEPALITQYVNTGKARLEWRDFPFLGPESTSAAIAARAAGRQGKFWAYHDALYAQQHPENSGALSNEYLVGLAGRLGLDTKRFQADVADPTLGKQVAADSTEGGKLGVNGTPTLLINGQLMSGAEPLQDYQKAIDTALARANAAR